MNVLPRKYPPEYYNSTSGLNSWYKAWWLHFFMLFTPNSGLTIWILPQKLRSFRPGSFFPFPLFNFGESAWCVFKQMYPHEQSSWCVCVYTITIVYAHITHSMISFKYWGRHMCKYELCSLNTVVGAGNSTKASETIAWSVGRLTTTD